MKPVTQFYHELGPMYDLVWGKHRHHGYWESGDTSDCIQSATLKLLEKVTAPLSLKSGQHIADIGSGTGACAHHLAENYHVTISAIEPSSSHSHHHPAVSLLPENWLKNSLLDNSLDAAYAIESLPHVSDPQRFFAEIFRTLKPGAKATVATWTYAAHLSYFEKRLIRKIKKEGALYGLRTNEQYRQMIQRSGLKLLSQSNMSSSVRQTWSHITRRAIYTAFTQPLAYLFIIQRLFSLKGLYLFSAPRLRLSYETGCIQYFLYELEKPLEAHLKNNR